MGFQEQTHLLRLEAFRRARGWSQQQLAAFLGAGFSVSTISLIETQRLRPTARQLARLRDLFGTEAESMLNPIDLHTLCHTTEETRP